MKYAKAHTLSARHPLCLAALDLWRLDEEVSRWIKEVMRAEELVSSTKQLRERAQMVIKQLRKERKEKANEASAHLREIDKLLLRVQARYQNVVKICYCITKGVSSFVRDLNANMTPLFAPGPLERAGRCNECESDGTTRKRS